MAHVVRDRVKETTTVTGTGNVTLLGAPTGFKTFATAFPVGDQIYYAIVGQGSGEWETGAGELINSTTLKRNQVFESSNSNNAVNFSAGTKDIFSTTSADRINEIFTQGQSIAAMMGAAMP